MTVATEPPELDRRPVMTQRWQRASFLHWPFAPDDVQRMLPAGLEVDTFDGLAWVGLVAFEMVDIAPAGFPAVPRLGTFPETNVRTYVKGPDGSPGVWFHSLDADRLLPVLVARGVYRLPYFWSRMRIDETASGVRYVSRRRWPGPPGVGGPIEIEIGDPIHDVGEQDAFLTARWRLFTTVKQRIWSAGVAHPPWPLHEARATEVSVDLLSAAGYARPVGAPVARYAPGVPVAVTSLRPIVPAG